MKKTKKQAEWLKVVKNERLLKSASIKRQFWRKENAKPSPCVVIYAA